MSNGTFMEARESSSGFSMLELVVALAMAAVLVAYAVPSYLAYAARGHRIDAVIGLHRAAQYLAANTAAGRFAAGQAPGLPAGLAQVPEHGQAVYRLELSLAGESSGGYELRAIPADEGPMRGDACGTFVLDALGMRTNAGLASDSARIERCWSGRAA
jgi:type IV pilus assembly protein PilE